MTQKALPPRDTRRTSLASRPMVRTQYRIMSDLEALDRRGQMRQGKSVQDRDRRRGWTEIDLHLPAQQIGHQTGAIRDVDQFDAGHHLKKRAEDMVRTADAI